MHLYSLQKVNLCSPAGTLGATKGSLPFCTLFQPRRLASMVEVEELVSITNAPVPLGVGPGAARARISQAATTPKT